MRRSEKSLSFRVVGDAGQCPLCPGGLCSDAAIEDLAWLERITTRKAFRPGDCIVSAGAHLTHIGTVHSGLAMLSRMQDRGTRQIVGALHPGDFLGTPRPGPARFDVMALSKVEICAVQVGNFARLLDRVPAMQHHLVQHSLDDLDSTRFWTGVLSRRTARQKLAALLVHFALRQNNSPLQGEGCRVDMQLSREQIADLLSLTFETVSRQTTALVRDGLLQSVTRRIFEVPDLQALMRASGDDADGGLYHH